MNYACVISAFRYWLPQDDLLVTSSEVDITAERYELDAEQHDIVAVDGTHLGFLDEEGARQYSKHVIEWLDQCVY